jgi:hypothetical protein
MLSSRWEKAKDRYLAQSNLTLSREYDEWRFIYAPQHYRYKQQPKNHIIPGLGNRNFSNPCASNSVGNDLFRGHGEQFCRSVDERENNEQNGEIIKEQKESLARNEDGRVNEAIRYEKSQA